MRVPKRPFVFSLRNTKFYSCTQTAIRLFTAEYEILQLCPNGHFFFHSEIQNFTVVPKRLFIFYSEIQNLELFPNGHSIFFYNETQKFEICTQTPICFSEQNREF